jgi:DNA-binding LacI/PurR family transcriptional regulator
MRVKLHDVARRAGVSSGTASMALRLDPRVAEKTRERVQNAAEALGYVPNQIGRALRSQRSYLIGYLLPTATASFYPELIAGISEVSVAGGYGLILAATEESIDSEQFHLRFLREKCVDGIIVSHYHREMTGNLLRFDADVGPVVVCDFPTFDPAIPAARVDDDLATRITTEHLIGLGHCRLAYCFCATEHSLSRFRACAAALSAHDLPAPVLCESAGDLARALRSESRPTGIVCYSDAHAVEAKHAVEELALRVPADVSIVGFDDMPYAAWPELDLTTLAQPKREIGRASAELLLARIEGRPAESRILEGELIVRGSTAPPCER